MTHLVRVDGDDLDSKLVVSWREASLKVIRVFFCQPYPLRWAARFLDRHWERILDCCPLSSTERLTCRVCSLIDGDVLITLTYSTMSVYCVEHLTSPHLVSLFSASTRTRFKVVRSENGRNIMIICRTIRNQLLFSLSWTALYFLH